MITQQEQIYGNNLIEFYSTQINKDQDKINEFVYADDSEKIIMIKTFLIKIVNPYTTSKLEIQQLKVAKLTEDVSAITDYTKVARKA